MRNVTVVSAFVPLKVRHMQADQYKDLGQKMFDAALAGGAICQFYEDFPIEQCWSYEMCKSLPPATETPADRYDSPEAHVASHIVQHTRTQWAIAAAEERNSDVVVWLDLGILKQGAWNGNPVTQDDISQFIEKVRQYDFFDIPFPGIDPEKKPVLPYGNNWRFCGSTHVWPARMLKDIHTSYRANLVNFVRTTKKVPLDLTIWPLVEHNSGLPFKWYQAEYDNTQLRNFP